jgi:hypothetical protein
MSDIAGVWRLESATLRRDGAESEWFGADPDGLLILAENRHFTEALTRTDMTLVASGDRMTTTAEEDRMLAGGTVGSYGTYTVDDDGQLVGQRLLGSTFPNWSGTARGPEQVHAAVVEGRLVQRLTLDDGAVAQMVWRSVGTAGEPVGKNQVAATWRLSSAVADTPLGRVEPFGPEPAGYLIFADGMYFTDVLHRPGLPAVAAGSWLVGTAENDAHAVRDTLVVFGTYTVDEEGAFKDEVVLRSSFPNWNGMSRDTRSLTETVEGDVMREHLDDGDGVVIDIEFVRER